MSIHNDPANGVSPAAVAPVLAAENLHKNYGPARALGGVSLAVAAGESVAIMGASGSGKTTLLHALAGIIRPDAGAVTFRSIAGPVRVDELSEKERSRLRRESFGFVFQQGLLLPELTALENVALPLMMVGYPRREAEGRAMHWLHLMGLAGFEARRIGELSGGQAQRVAIARAQVTGATVIFADEPTGALDSATGDDVMSALLDSTVGQGNTLVVVTHDETVAARCSRTIRMRDGMLQQAASQAAPQAVPHAAQPYAAPQSSAQWPGAQQPPAQWPAAQQPPAAPVQAAPQNGAQFLGAGWSQQ
ncbi:ABC transporter ATP-binding protein [Microbacterium sp. MPKO10]|uniref:ABC transporter ATP-binding protein n=1 Tax=Microbacterium sp. MPKO10 TaxID=2989818 RepID=UPI002235A316|nr:ABC transporter ATP-binding protein [Microbacterium sp. MPKO10]MCW4458982.1 ABC transporter ATP-binding protein [Microbacterium sp. MPKO10]